jgi:hypothetical protein
MSGPWHPTGRAKVDPRAPKAIGVCNRCGFWYQRSELVPQYEWAGVKQQNLELYICTRTCYDTPQIQLKTIIIPADPMPVYRPFPEPFALDDTGGTDIPSGPSTGFMVEDVTENWEAGETGPLPAMD